MLERLYALASSLLTLHGRRAFEAASCRNSARPQRSGRPPSNPSSLGARTRSRSSARHLPLSGEGPSSRPARARGRGLSFRLRRLLAAALSRARRPLRYSGQRPAAGGPTSASHALRAASPSAVRRSSRSHTGSTTPSPGLHACTRARTSSGPVAVGRGAGPPPTLPQNRLLRPAPRPHRILEAETGARARESG